MAEGGENQDENNPFSFKSFVTKKDKKKTPGGRDSTDDDIDIFDIPDTTTQRKRDKQKQILVVDEEPKQSQKKKGKSENPFSFKKFLSGSSGKSSEKQSFSHSQHPPSQRLSGELHSMPDLHVAGDLPDFVQDHYTDNIPPSPRGLELPDFTVTGVAENIPDIGDTNFPKAGFLKSSAGGRLGQRQHIHKSEDNQSDFDENSDSEVDSVQQIGLVNSLPDFISDAAVSATKNSDSAITSIPVISQDSRYPSAQSVEYIEIQRLCEENSQLQKQIEDLKGKRLHDAERISELQRQMVEQKKKELEETAAMERAMEQVEENLSATTKRAVLAESTVSKLKQDVKTLQIEIKALRGENGMLQGEQYLSDVKERTSYVAQQLSDATKTAETSLRQLLAGVDNLKLLSQVLESIDKIQEETQPPENKKSPESS